MDMVRRDVPLEDIDAGFLDLRKQLADFERSTKPMGDAIPIGQLICMALRYRSDQIGCPQPAL